MALTAEQELAAKVAAENANNTPIVEVEPKQIKISGTLQKIEPHTQYKGQMALSLNGVSYFAPLFAVKGLNAGDVISIIVEDRIANVTGYLNKQTGEWCLHTKSSQTGVVSAYLDCEATRSIKAKAEAGGKLAALYDFAQLVGSDEKMLDTIQKLKGLI